MQDEDGVFAELSAALQFPPYFGWNWDAVNDCMRDLEWLENASGYLVVVEGAERLLATDDRLLRRWLRRCAEYSLDWRVPRQWSLDYTRPPKPFHVAFQVDDKFGYEALSGRLTAAEATLLETVFVLPRFEVPGDSAG